MVCEKFKEPSLNPFSTGHNFYNYMSCTESSLGFLLLFFCASVLEQDTSEP